DLQRKRELAVDVLMQAVVAAGTIGEQKRCRAPLPGLVAFRKKCVERWCIDVRRARLQPSDPPIRGRRQSWIQLRAERLDDLGKRRREVLVLAGAEPKALHLDAAAKPRVVLIQRRKSRTLRRRQQRRQGRKA